MFDIPDRVTSARFEMAVFPPEHPLHAIHPDLNVYRVLIDKTVDGWQVSSPAGTTAAVCTDLAEAFAVAVEAAECRRQALEVAWCDRKVWAVTFDADGLIVEVAATYGQPDSVVAVDRLVAAGNGGAALLPFLSAPVPAVGGRVPRPSMLVAA